MTKIMISHVIISTRGGNLLADDLVCCNHIGFLSFSKLLPNKGVSLKHIVSSCVTGREKSAAWPKEPQSRAFHVQIILMTIILNMTNP